MSKDGECGVSNTSQESSLPKPPEKVWFLLHCDGFWYGPYDRAEGDEDAGEWQAYVPEGKPSEEDRTVTIYELEKWADDAEFYGHFDLANELRERALQDQEVSDGR